MIVFLNVGDSRAMFARVLFGVTFQAVQRPKEKADAALHLPIRGSPQFVRGWVPTLLIVQAESHVPANRLDTSQSCDGISQRPAQSSWSRVCLRADSHPDPKSWFRQHWFASRDGLAQYRWGARWK